MIIMISKKYYDLKELLWLRKNIIRIKEIYNYDKKYYKNQNKKQLYKF